jgi:undecaprenyl-diphosphatase
LRLRKLLELDARWSDKLRVADNPGLLRTLAAFIAHSGDSWFWGLGLLVVFLFAGWSWKILSLHFVGAIIITAILVMTIKLIVRRQRPEGEWGAIYRNTDPHSFPSGHAARAILLAVLALGMGPTWLAIIITLWAPLVALARVAMGVHYLSDVLAGGILGMVIGTIWIVVLG